MKTLTRSLACLVAVAGCATAVVALGGCSKDEKPTKMKPTTMATTMPAMKASTPTADAKPAAPAVMMKESDMTHTVVMDTPVFSTMPTDAAAKPAMMLKKGEKVVVMIPRGKYAQVTTIGGMKGYVVTAALKPIGN